MSQISVALERSNRGPSVFGFRVHKTCRRLDLESLDPRLRHSRKTRGGEVSEDDGAGASSCLGPCPYNCFTMFLPIDLLLICNRFPIDSPSLALTPRPSSSPMIYPVFANFTNHLTCLVIFGDANDSPSSWMSRRSSFAKASSSILRSSRMKALQRG